MARRRAIFPGVERPVILAHRGFSAEYPENTMAAFTAAREAGAGGIELDVQMCSTGEIVVFHDYTTDRVTATPGRIDAQSWKALSTLRVGGTEPIPLLRDVLDAFGDSLCYDIEIKHSVRGATGIEDALVSMIASRGLEDRCLISSFNPYAIRETRRRSQRLPVAIIYSRSSGVPWFLRNGFGRYMSAADALKPEHVQYTRGHALGAAVQAREVFVWTVDEAEDMKRSLARGAAGVITNHPARAYEALRGSTPR
ncbi:MAG: glycerophosphodiester phosphodiesterase [Spirochaetaceae bacterium]